MPPWASPLLTTFSHQPKKKEQHIHYWQNIYIEIKFCHVNYPPKCPLNSFFIIFLESFNLNFFFIIKNFRTIVFIFIVISTTFRPICPLAFFRCLSNTGTYTELRTTSFIESTGVTCSDSVSHNRVQVLSIPVLLLACSQDWTCNLQMIVSLEA